MRVSFYIDHTSRMLFDKLYSLIHCPFILTDLRSAKTRKHGSIFAEKENVLKLEAFRD